MAPQRRRRLDAGQQAAAALPVGDGLA